MAEGAPSAEDLANAKMKKVETKESSGDVDPELAKNLTKIYNDNGGDIAKISAATGVNFKDGWAPSDAEAFVKGFNNYTMD
mmetsp:Transcript_34130/g.63703  ORF Transcript_34130/g.63703 Transcript_34130/m.63703 type:complete len:81 (+) Transcript_34130:110-352(+)|eukprot:CAMPEP_0184029370 /NCGR_PEP_ID=MMETSP0955-20130417/380_1 /TAXON_ID=627963 /ORGANISM="Aplanochytrium sp, Strain PBS07" /LENGTH=80 /DNA_ID=CAMNT_0026314409 /DNA_START=165 /DNA_END=407 /DNA_ORIENTATION=-